MDEIYMLCSYVTLWSDIIYKDYIAYIKTASAVRKVKIIAGAIWKIF